MTVRVKGFRTTVIREADGSYAIACSDLGVYTVGKTVAEAKRNLAAALNLHLEVLRAEALRRVETALPAA